jgi:iron complex outermembrane receptor protein
MRFPALCSISAVLLLASGGTTFASNPVAPVGQGDLVGGSSTQFAPESWVPCKPAAAQSIFAINDAVAKGTMTRDSASRPCTPSTAAEIRIADASSINPVGRSPAAATEQSAAGAAPPESELQEVVVTGSRIARPDFVSQQPILTVSSSDLESSAKVDVAAALEQSPAFLNGEDQNYNSNGPNGGKAELNLRGLGASRTLVLLDGRRLSPVDGTGVADINEIPQGIVDNIQTITGGASAAYGSDAMAGVVNIISKNIDGVEIGLSHGAADGGFGKNNDLYITLGSAFGDNKGHAMASFEYTQRDAIVGNQIPFFFYGGQGANLAYGAYTPATSPTGFAATNLPSQAAINAYYAACCGLPAGTVSNSFPLAFGPNGSLFDQHAPYYNYPGCTPNAPGCAIITVNGLLEQAIGQYAYVTIPQNRYAAFSKLTYALTDNTNIYAQFLANYNREDTQFSFPQLSTNALISIPVTNPFIPSALATILASRPNPKDPFTFNKRLLNFPSAIDDESFDTDQFIVGANGKIPVVNFTWDIYYMHDYSLDTELSQAVSQYRLQTLLSAADGGNSICSGGFNPFQGYTSSTSTQCVNYLYVTTHASTAEYQDTVEANLGGKVVTLPAGDVRFDLTGDWRQWVSSYTPDDLNVLGNPPSPTVVPANPTNGEISLREGALELFVPLLKDKPFAQSWNIDLAYRYSDYNIVGTTDAYKFTTDWRPAQSLLVRGGYEHAIRAPNMNDLFQLPTSVSQNIGNPPVGGDPCDYRSSLRSGPNAAQITAICIAQGIAASAIGTYTFNGTSTSTQTSGSLALKPEIGDTFTFGVVLSPAFSNPVLEHVQLSLDYYHIRIADAIGSSGYLYVLDNCYNINGGNPTFSPTNPYCALITRPLGGSTSSNSFIVGQPTMNLGGELDSGVDVELDWNWRLADLGLGARSGQLHLNSAVTWTDEFEIQTVPKTPWNNYVGTVSQLLSPTPPLPRWRGLTTLSYALAPVPVTVGLRWRYIDGMVDSSKVLTPNSTIGGVGTYNYLDLVASWKISNHLDLSGTLTNLTGRTPPIVNGTPGFTQPQLYDITNLTYLVSLHGKF